MKGDAFFVIYSPCILLKCHLAPWAVWWHLCCTVLISSDYCEVILTERSTPVLGAAISGFLPVWCCFTSQGLDTAGEGGLGKQEILMGTAHIPSTRRRLHIMQTELGPLSLWWFPGEAYEGFSWETEHFQNCPRLLGCLLILRFVLPTKGADRELLSHFLP